MGWINAIKEETAVKEAQHAWDAGRNILVFKFIEAHTNSLVSGAITGMNEQMEAIEEVGWKLDHMSVAEGNVIGAMGSKRGERMVIICLYRRPSPAA
ncbi:hypothetical protein ABZW18_21275 [Streptomyces sp. NPDC004647]|uniref:hypothetical protein n=1 Tax=Streptomyces sp. NPDC004647 TaxID=3154671 RepID=UPI0033A13AD2